MATSKNFIVKNGLEVGGQEVIDSSGVVTSAALGGQTLSTTDSPTFAGLTVDTNTLYVDAANNRVGLGTTSPTRKLDVNGVIGIRDGTLTGGGGVELSSLSGFGAAFQALNYKFMNATNSSEYMRIDSSGNVGIGTTSPDAKLNVVGSGTGQVVSAYVASEFMGDATTKHTNLLVSSSNNTSSNAFLSLRSRSSGGQWYYSQIVGSNANLDFYVADTVNSFPDSADLAMRIDSSKAIYVGKSSQDISLAGHEFHPQGFVFHTRANAEVLYLRRNSSDGPIQNFYRDGSLVGSIGVNAQRPYIGARLASTDANIKFTDVQVLPCDATGSNTDGVMNLGSSGARFNDVWSQKLYVSNSGANYWSFDRDNVSGDLIIGDSGSTILSIKTSSGRISNRIYGINFDLAGGLFYEKRGGKRTGTGTYTLFTNGSSTTQSGGYVRVTAIYGTPSGVGVWLYKIGGERSIHLVWSSTTGYSGSAPSVSWNSSALEVSNSNGSVYYTVEVELFNIGNGWSATWGNFPGFVS